MKNNPLILICMFLLLCSSKSSESVLPVKYVSKIPEVVKEDSLTMAVNESARKAAESFVKRSEDKLYCE